MLTITKTTNMPNTAKKPRTKLTVKIPNPKKRTNDKLTNLNNPASYLDNDSVYFTPGTKFVFFIAK